jgi:formate transporter
MPDEKDPTSPGSLQEATFLKMGNTLDAIRDKLGTLDSADYPPPEMAKRAVTVGCNKSGLNTLSTILLGMMAGIFIGLGAMLCTFVTTNTGLGFGVTKLLGGIVFCLGLILVVVAGAELFTGNTLIVMSCISRRSTWIRLARNWFLVYFANLAGSLLLVLIMYYTQQWTLSSNGVGATALTIANSKMDLSWIAELTRGIMCNMLVCLAIWLCFSAKTVPGKILAILFPITAFVTAGFEHSIANMYFLPMGVMMSHQSAVVQASSLSAATLSNVNVMGVVGNLIPVTIGNIIGGSIMVGVVYWYSYLRQEAKPK